MLWPLYVDRTVIIRKRLHASLAAVSEITSDGESYMRLQPFVAKVEQDASNPRLCRITERVPAPLGYWEMNNSFQALFGPPVEDEDGKGMNMTAQFDLRFVAPKFESSIRVRETEEVGVVEVVEVIKVQVLSLIAPIYGVSCNQAVYYFRHYKKDSWKIKTAVAAVWLLETLNTVFSAHALMSFVIYNRRAGPSYPFPWTISVQASTNTLIGTIVQIFFAWRVWILSVRRLWLTAVLVVLSMTQCVLGQILTLYGLGAVNPLAKDDFAALLRASFALTAVTDIVVAVALCYFLHIRKSGSKSTDSLIRSLMVMTINCGVLSSSIAVAALVTLVVVPHTLLPLSCCILLGKAYAMPPRNVGMLQGGGFAPGPQLTGHRTPGQAPQVQTMTPQPTPGFLQSRGQGMHAFGGALGQHQTASALQQQMQSQQSNGTAQSVTSNDAVSLDPNDFPALGSTPPSNPTGSGNNGAAGNGTSYASQAGTGVQLGGSGGVGSLGSGGIGGGAANANQPRDFTPDDFPALGGQSQSQNQNSSQNQNPGQENHSHPPGLNGFQHSDHSQQQHRQNLLGALGGNIPPGTPGMLNLSAAQTRNVHPGFQQGQGDMDKQQHQRVSPPTLFVKNAMVGYEPIIARGLEFPNPNPPPSSTNSNTNGAHSQSISAHLNAPPGMPSPSGGPFPQTPGLGTNGGATQSTPFPSNGATQGDSHATAPSHPPSNPNTSTNQNTSSLQNSATSHQPHPQTPAQQVLISPADRWGLLGLLEMIKNASSDVDGGLSSMGTDLGTMGLDMNYPGSLYPTFITPWADQSAAHSVEPDFNLPACYLSVQAPPPGPQKAMAFSDETLFFMFYSSPRDALQEVAAQELFNRNWRYHKELRLWITKETGTTPSQKVQGGEQGRYTFWDPENWCKERKEMTVLYTELEEKNVPAFANTLTLVPANQGQNVPQQQPVQGLSAQMQAQRGSFQMGVASL
ncbi:hypothetical protein D9756_004952 [Leucocoprinus leucothites]|uniref:NOT2/NOT3/NOT5 C-terminal domain-containing protein n=1 Tax=Leucocoprinus leucothites TaxID=201217 RepID=A0A8H5LKA0_9AGAR|nr:hypothetical protein D9756_004952 [Leucoagaricus leucothites]